MKHRLTMDDAVAAVWGGALLGGGGGGFTDEGEAAARAALGQGAVELWSADEFADDALSANVALVGAPSAPNMRLTLEHLARTIELLRRELPAEARLACLHTNESGAQTTVNGWMQAAITGLPVLDLACNGRAFPSSVMGALGLHRVSGYVSLQTYAGGDVAHAVEGVVRANLVAASSVVRHASVMADGAVAVARNPVGVGYARRNGAPGAISQAIEIGRAYLDHGLPAALAQLGGRIVAEGVVREVLCERREGLDLGHVHLDDAAQTSLPFINEYMLIEQAGARVAAFPDLITTVGEDDRPVATATVRAGMRLRVLHAPRARLLLSCAIDMTELYEPLEAAMGQRFAPVAPGAAPAR